MYKLRLSLPLNYFLILKSYLHSRHFHVKAETEYTELSSVNAGVPTSTTATFANDTVVVARDSDPALASQKLQTNLPAIQNWFKKMENESQ
jgi:hypothetical protein